MKYGDKCYILLPGGFAQADYCGYYYQGCQQVGKHVVHCESMGGIRMEDRVWQNVRDVMKASGERDNA